MSDPGEATASSRTDPDRPTFQSLRPIWELELLISGAAVFSLFQLPSLLSRLYLGLELHLSSRLFLLPFLLFYVVSLVVIALILAFSTHFFLRGFWVALCGLNAVFPDGIRWDRYDGGPVQGRVFRDLLPEPKELERRVDRLASSVFSVLFLIVLSLLFSLLWVLALVLVAMVATRFVDPDANPLVAFYVLLVIFVAPPLSAGLVDQWFKKDAARVERHPRLARLVERIVRGFQWLTFARFYNSILLVFSTHFSTRRASVGTLVASFGLAALFLTYFSVRAGVLGFDSYVFFPTRPGPTVMNAQHYGSLAEPGHRERGPTIQSDVVEGPYLRLFIPYLPDRDRELVAEHCPEVDPLRGEGLFLARRKRGTPEEVDALAECLSRIYRIELNGRRIAEPEPTFYRRPEDGTAGVLVHLPTAGLPAGRNLLEVARLPGEEDDDEEDDDEADRHHYYIPFWR